MLLVERSVCFKASFDYFNQIYLNASTFRLSIGYNVKQLEQSSDNFIKTCHTVIKELDELRLDITNLNIANSSSKSFIIPNYENFDDASASCKKFSPSCSMASFENFTTYMTPYDLQEANTNNAFLDYRTNDFGELYTSSGAVSPSDPILSRPIKVLSCPPHFFVHGAFCLHFGKHSKSLTLAHEYCKRTDSQSTLYSISTMDDLDLLTTFNPSIFPKVKDSYLYWISSSPSDFENLRFCHNKIYSIDTYRTLVYDAQKRCLIQEYYQDSYYGTMCIVSSKYSSSGFNSDPGLTSYLTKVFAKQQGAVSVDDSGQLTLAYAMTQRPSVCCCSNNQLFDDLKMKYYSHLLSKLNTAMYSVKNKCYAVTYPLLQSPYIVASSDIPDFSPYSITSQNASSVSSETLKFHRQKRGLGIFSLAIPFIQAAFRIGGYLFNTDHGNKILHGITHILPRKFNPKLDSSINSLNRSISVRRTNTAYQDKLVNTIDMLQQQLKHSVATKYISDDLLKQMKMQHVLTTQSITNIKSSLRLSSILSGVNTIVDTLLLKINDMGSVVMHATDSYTKLMQCITAEIPIDDPIIHKYVLQAMTKIPKGYSFMNSGLHQILSGAKIRYSIDGNIITAAILIPVIKEDSVLYLFHSKPLPYNTSSGVPVLPYFEKPYLAVTGDKRLYTMLTADDLLPCTHKDTYICQSLSLYQSARSSCLFDHFLGDSLSASHHCQYIKLVQSTFQITSDHKLHYYAKHPTSARFHCSGAIHGHPGAKPISDLGILQIPSGCSVSVDGFEGRNPKLPVSYQLPESVKPICPDENTLVNLPADTAFLDQLQMQVVPQSIRLENTAFHNSAEFHAVLLGSIFLSLLVSCVCLTLIRLKLVKHTSSVNLNLSSSKHTQDPANRHYVMSEKFHSDGETIKIPSDVYVKVDKKGKCTTVTKTQSSLD